MWNAEKPPKVFVGAEGGPLSMSQLPAKLQQTHFCDLI